MNLRVSSTLPCSAEAAWRAEREVATLLKGAWPWLVYSPVAPPRLPEKWTPGQTLTVRTRLFGLLPLGQHTISVAEVDENSMTVLTHEHGGLIRRWDHRVRITPDGPNGCRYTDEIDLDAGLLTPIVWLFAWLFYNDRQIGRYFKAERANT